MYIDCKPLVLFKANIINFHIFGLRVATPLTSKYLTNIYLKYFCYFSYDYNTVQFIFFSVKKKKKNNLDIAKYKVYEIRINGVYLLKLLLMTINESRLCILK